jgi:CDP-paratose 2-epimerase
MYEQVYENVLVTGGAGFVGSALAMGLARSGLCKKVTAFDNLKRRGSELNVKRLAAAGVGFAHGDVRSFGDLAEHKPDLILECSAEPSAQAGYGGSPEYLINTNLVGCFNCLELARRENAAFLFISTSRVYPYKLLNGLEFVEDETRYSLAAVQELRGASEFGISEEFPLDGARSLYGMTKLSAELMVQEYADAYGLRTVIDRCGLLTGPWQMGKSDQGVIALWVAAHYFKRNLKYIGFGGTGKQVRDFLHIDDFCDLVLMQMKDLAQFDGQLYNVGGGVAGSLSLLECTRLCAEISGNEIEILPVPENRPADLRIYLTDSRKITAQCGWAPKRDARTTLRDIYDWIKDEESLVRSVLG